MAEIEDNWKGSRDGADGQQARNRQAACRGHPAVPHHPAARSQHQAHLHRSRDHPRLPAARRTRRSCCRLNRPWPCGRGLHRVGHYVINEWFDRDFDRHHPTKSQRSAVQSAMDGKIIGIEWLVLVALGLVCAAASGRLMLLATGIFALQGIVYNVPPLRSKDKAYFDVISESVNNPLRLLIGWAMIDPTSLPPGSVILCYWFGGAFLMAAKRLSEYREIAASHGRELLARYRASFADYSEVSLTASCLSYSLFSVFFLSVFLVKYRIEYILAMPLVVMLFTTYFSMSTSPGSSAQKPEKLYGERGLMLIVLALVAVFLVASFVDMPFLARLAEQHYITLD
ncbi:UbiA family prenyltransferase [Bradyrhizobium sp. 27S5]|uniref:UbiA family prenyltransferase n=1 Tax=Bradyrhizobium sp. 27S5 TaxID=3139728 RepID=UPI0030D3F941